MDISEENYQKAIAVVWDTSSGSVSNLQRKLCWGYCRAAAAIDRMQKEFIVSPMSASGRRDVYPSDIHQLWKELQVAKTPAVPEGFVLVPKELSGEKADAQAMLAWGCYAGLFKSQNRDMSAFQVEEFRLKWCKNKALELQEEYRVAIKAQEQGHE